MSAVAWATCDCCSMLFGYKLESALMEFGKTPERCGFCSRRGGLCMHNAGSRSRDFELGVRVKMHSSRPHGDASGADDPDTCQWCLAKLLERR